MGFFKSSQYLHDLTDQRPEKGLRKAIKQASIFSRKQISCALIPGRDEYSKILVAQGWCHQPYTPEFCAPGVN